jgi:hypothetical protein
MAIDESNSYDTNSVGINNANDGFDQILESANTKSTSERSSAVATNAEIDAVVKTIIQQKNLTQDQATYNRVLATLAHFVQIGATSPKFATTRIISDYGINIKAGDLRDACNRNNITTRKFARGISDYVIKVAFRFGIEGNLAKRYKLENPTCDKQDLIWVSDFQTFSENTAMPDHVRTWLLENYKNRFKPNN